MGVMQCDRGSCSNVCCDFMLGSSQYICSSCFLELCNWRETWDSDTKVSEVALRIKQFMRSDPGDYSQPPDSSDPADVEAEWERLKPHSLHNGE